MTERSEYPDAAFAHVSEFGRLLMHHTSDVVDPDDNDTVDQELLNVALENLDLVFAAEDEKEKIKEHLEAHKSALSQKALKDTVEQAKSTKMEVFAQVITGQATAKLKDVIEVGSTKMYDVIVETEEYGEIGFWVSVEYDGEGKARVANFIDTMIPMECATDIADFLNSLK